MAPALALLVSIIGSGCFGHTALADPSRSETAAVFRFHIPDEPHSLDPARISGSETSYLFQTVMRGLYSYRSDRGLVPEDAESCTWLSPLRLRCTLTPQARWSDGAKVKASEYVRGFRRLLAAQAKIPGVESLKHVKNALKIHRGEISAEALGLSAPDENTLVFEFAAPDADFLYKLTSFVFVPVRLENFPELSKSANLPVNGPYQIASWEPGKRLVLQANSHYHRGQPGRPPVEVLFIEDDATALALYEKGDLSFLRRLPSSLISQYEKRKDFQQRPMARFDYVGFGDVIRDQADYRAALALSLNFTELAKILRLRGQPGCSGLSTSLLGDRSPCLNFDLAQAKKHWARIPETLRKKRLTFMFSGLGGEDVKRAAEWMQSQWLKHLGVRVELQSMEQGFYLQKLRTEPPSLFRKGVGLDRPTCLAALEIFSPQGSENFLRLDHTPYNLLLTRLGEALNSAAPKTAIQKLCAEGVQQLLSEHRLIPLGPMHFTFLARPEFTGWDLNELNQLDLGQLRHSKSASH